VGDVFLAGSVNAFALVEGPHQVGHVDAALVPAARVRDIQSPGQVRGAAAGAQHSRRPARRAGDAS
jgi:hypothetical protein